MPRQIYQVLPLSFFGFCASCNFSQIHINSFTFHIFLIVLGKEQFKYSASNLFGYKMFMFVTNISAFSHVQPQSIYAVFFIKVSILVQLLNVLNQSSWCHIRNFVMQFGELTFQEIQPYPKVCRTSSPRNLTLSKVVVVGRGGGGGFISHQSYKLQLLANVKPINVNFVTFVCDLLNVEKILSLATILTYGVIY